MMRAIVLASTALTLVASPALAEPSFSLIDGKAEEGKPAPVQVKKHGTLNDQPSTVIVYTMNGTAKEPTDYRATGSVLTFAPTETLKSIDVPTIKRDGTQGTRRVGTKLIALENARSYDGTGFIDISDALAPPPPPPPPPVVCPDGTTLPAGSTCPVVLPPPPPPPPPPPTAHRDNAITFAGDSQSVTWANTTPGGNWTNVYRATRTGKGLVAACPIAVSGRVFGAPTDANGLNNPTEIAKVDECNGEVVVFVPSGSNDGKPSWNPAWTPDTWLARAFMWADTLTAKGYKVAIGTILPQGMPSDPTFLAKQNAFRKEANTKLVAQAPAHKVTVIDLRTDTVLDADNAPLNAGLYAAVDQLHLTGCSGPDGPEGQCRVYRAAAPVLDALLGINGSVVVPPPPPPPPPPPVVIEGVGLPPIPSNFDVNKTVRTTGVIPPGQPTVNEDKGAFRFICGASWIGWVDPIVNPGGVSSHLHQGYGNEEITPTNTYAEARAAAGSRCNHVDGGIAANRSQYWMPAMLDGKGNIVQPDYIQVYYKREPASAPICQLNKCITIPNGLQFVFGFDMATGKIPAWPGHFHCEGGGSVTKVTYDLPSQAGLCKPGGYLVALIDTPKCWNGKDVDSLDHRSHLADAVANVCPATHPYRIPQFTQGAHYSVLEGDDVSKWMLSCDEMFPNLKPGQCFHADYKEAWDVGVKQEWTANCIDKFLNCSGGELGNGRQLIGAAAGTTGRTYPERLQPLSKFPRPIK